MHARRIWIACGPGNNAGDGLRPPRTWQAWGFAPWVTWLARPSAARRTRDIRQRAVAAGVALADAPPEKPWARRPDHRRAGGIGARRAPDGRMAEWIARIHAQARAGSRWTCPPGWTATPAGVQSAVRARHTPSLLTLAGPVHCRRARLRRLVGLVGRPRPVARRR